MAPLLELLDALSVGGTRQAMLDANERIDRDKQTVALVNFRVARWNRSSDEVQSMKRRFFVGVALSLMIICGQDALADEWDDAEKSVVRLSAAAFTRVPAAVIKALSAEGCSIPQATSFEPGLHNVVRGRFASRRQIDYAALCSKNGSSHITIVWGGSARCASRIEERNDKDYLQTDTTGIVYSRAIFPASQKEIRDFQTKLQGPRAPDRLHEGIGDHFLGKASVILYCAQGQWLWHELQGMD